VVRLASAGRGGCQGEAWGAVARTRAGLGRDYCPTADRGLNGVVAGQSSKIGAWLGANQGGVGSAGGMGCWRSRVRDASNDGDVCLPKLMEQQQPWPQGEGVGLARSVLTLVGCGEHGRGGTRTGANAKMHTCRRWGRAAWVRP
jgi:hypothetical protein